MIKLDNYRYFLIKYTVNNIFFCKYLKINLITLFKHYLKILTINDKCLISLNMSKFSKISFYCRQVLNLKIQAGEILGIFKHSW